MRGGRSVTPSPSTRRPTSGAIQSKRAIEGFLSGATLMGRFSAVKPLRFRNLTEQRRLEGSAAGMALAGPSTAQALRPASITRAPTLARSLA